jgi:hypothetical protein
MMTASNPGSRPDGQADPRGGGRFLIGPGDGPEVRLGGLARRRPATAGRPGGQEPARLPAELVPELKARHGLKLIGE